MLARSLPVSTGAKTFARAVTIGPTTRSSRMLAPRSARMISPRSILTLAMVHLHEARPLVRLDMLGVLHGAQRPGLETVEAGQHLDPYGLHLAPFLAVDPHG